MNTNNVLKEKISPEELEANLSKFSANLEKNYYFGKFTQITSSNKFLVTDGVKYLIDNADCYWLTYLYTSHLLHKKVYKGEKFTILSLKLNNNGGAKIKIEDGNGNILSEKSIPCIDFPLNEIYLFASNDGSRWVCMLPSEY